MTSPEFALLRLDTFESLINEFDKRKNDLNPPTELQVWDKILTLHPEESELTPNEAIFIQNVAFSIISTWNQHSDGNTNLQRMIEEAANIHDQVKKWIPT